MNATIPMTAVVLAAGKSSRMGRSKPLLPIGGVPLLEITLQKLFAFPFERIVCVVGHMQEAVREVVQPADPRFEWLVNPNYAEGQSASLRLAASACGDSALGMLVFLADQPFIRPDTIGRILDEARSAHGQPAASAAGKCVIQPVYHGQKGHPVYFSSPMLAHFGELAGDIGAKPAIRHADRHILVPVEDEGVLADLDTPEDYATHQPPK